MLSFKLTTTMTQPPRSDSPSAATGGSTIPLDHDATCANCGYSLRGLATGGQCPECGFTVQASLRKDHLADAPAPWRRRLRGGSVTLWLGITAIVPLNLPPVAVLLVAATLPSLAWARAGLALAVTLNTALMLAIVAGLWLLTSPQPGRAEPAADWRWRVAARAALLLGTVLVLVVLAMIVATGQALHGDWWLYDTALIAAGALMLVGLLTAWSHLAILAQRCPDEPLAHRLRRLRADWALAAGGVLLIAVAVNLLELVAGATAGQGINVWMLAAVPLVGLLTLWLWLTTWLAIRRLHVVLARLA